MKHGRYIYILGDVHGDFGALNKFINREIRQNKALKAIAPYWKDDDLQIIILQVGDFAYFWPGFDNTDSIKNKLELLPQSRIPIFWCGGNHEDWDKLDKYDSISEVDHGIFYCPFGSTLSLSPEVTVMFAGGAESADKGWRLSEMCKGSPQIWWPQEGIQESDLEKLPLREVEGGGSPSWVVSHTCPTGFPIEDALVGKQHRDRMPKFSEPSRGLLEIARRRFHPKQWFFGHFHVHMEGFAYGCDWEGLDIFNRGKGGYRKAWLEWSD